MREFVEFYEALHNRAPRPWQARLAGQVLTSGWPTLLDLPTGVGKTSALDVALYCLARAPDRMPRRTILVVDRRVVVDQGALHARRVKQALSHAKEGCLKEIADALRSLFGGEPTDPPFVVSVMRGGMPRDNDWARRPDQPVVGVSTVDQVGSRLLFRGYGVGARSASIHAGLIGNDTLILLDEVHLAVPFAETLEAIRERRRQTSMTLPDRFTVVQMSATPADAAETTRFRLDDADRSDKGLRRVLGASKRALLKLVKVSGDDEAKKREALAREAVEEAIRLLEKGSRTVGLVVNRVDTARAAAELALKAGKPTILVTGRMRPLDRDRVMLAVDQVAGPDRSRSLTSPETIIVSTQCIEAGADIDFDGLVTECASIDALKQRFGRVDRRGMLELTHSVVLARSDSIAPDADDPVYGGAASATWRWLKSIADSDEVDFGIARLPVQLPPETRPQPPHAPVLLPGHLDAWSQTSQRPSPDHDVSLWLHGPREGAAEVQVIWRKGIAVPQVAVALLSEVRPSSLESVSLPIGAVRRWLLKETPSEISDTLVGSEDPRQRSEPAKPPAAVLRFTGGEGDWIDPREIRPGDVLVVEAGFGGLSASSFDPNSADAVEDLSSLAQFRARRRAVWTLQAGSTVRVSSELLAVVPAATVDEESAAEQRDRFRDWVSSVASNLRFPPSEDGILPEGFKYAPSQDASEPVEGAAFAPGDWYQVLSVLSKRLKCTVFDATIVLSAPLPKGAGNEEDVVADAVTEDDASSFRSTEVSLTRHSEDVRSFARRFASALRLSPEIVDVVERAAWLHDVGKADLRFQSWLVGGDDVRAAALEQPLAKSALDSEDARARRRAMIRAKYPPGYRHELLSLSMIQSHPSLDGLTQEHRDLVLHLVASHHGWCRPFAPPVDAGEPLEVSLQHGDVTLRAGTQHQLARLDSGVSDRFWRLTERYGWWGLAWLEAIVRLADHRASEMEAEA